MYNSKIMTSKIKEAVINKAACAEKYNIFKLVLPEKPTITDSDVKEFIKSLSGNEEQLKCEENQRQQTSKKCMSPEDDKEFFEKKRTDLQHIKASRFLSDLVRKNGQVRSFYKLRGEHGGCFILVDADTRLSLKGFSGVLEKQDIHAVKDFVILKLASRAVTSLLVSEHAFEKKVVAADGLFYILDHFQFKNVKVDEVGFKAIAVDINPDWSTYLHEKGSEVIPDQVVAARTVTMLPETYAMKVGKYKHKPRYAMDNVSGLLYQKKGEKKNKNLLYVIGGFNGRKSNSIAFNYKSLVESRANCINDFVKTVNELFAGIIHIKLDSVDFCDHCRINFNSVTNEYKKIRELISNTPVQLVNISSYPNCIKKFKQIAEQNDVKLQITDNELAPAFVFVDSLDENNPEDEYKEFKQTTKAASQACTVDTLMNATRSETKAIFEKIIAEQVFAMEVKQKKFLIERPTLPDGWKFARPIPPEKDSDDMFTYSIVSIENIITPSGEPETRLHFSEEDELSTEMTLIRGLLKDNHSKYLFGKKNGAKERHPIAYNLKTGEYILFVRTGATAQPGVDDFLQVMDDMNNAEEQGAPRNAIEAILERTTNAALKNNLEQLLEDYPLQTLSKAHLQQYVGTTVKNKEKGLQTIASTYVTKFNNELFKETGMRFASPVKQKDCSILAAHVGMYMNLKNKTYFVGSPGAPGTNATVERFSKIYKLESNMKRLPEDLKTWFECYSVRNKQASVYPFIFKYCSEFSNWRRASKPKPKVRSLSVGSYSLFG